ncbi:ChaN family lipoprotein [Marinobacterium jannaschii]|uniref:ChaN family lipoprotein n=1 Tax=Marinobacterium jannaschii TaxID=64970 RepID=UPI0004891CB6|nr:ChaN family lipoprotein [Marinobacterium jannaschii]
MPLALPKFLLLLSAAGAVHASQAATPHLSPEIAWQSPILQQHPLTGSIYDTKQREAVSVQELLSSLRTAEFVLIGEKHDNPDHHAIEERLLSALLSDRKRSLVLEMLSSGDLQSSTAAILPEDADDQEIRKSLQWPEKGWSWSNYAPLARIAVKGNNPVRAGNINKETMMKVYQQGLASLDSARISSARQIPDAVYQKIRKQVHQEHCEMMPISQMNPMAEIQVARDASMAFSMTAKPPSVLIAGAYHTLQDQGVPLHLKILKPDSTIKTVIITEVIKDSTLPTEYPFTGKADYIWFTPRFSNRNYCEDLQQQ